MAKNNNLINQYKYLQKRVNQLTPEIYAAIALSLHRVKGWGTDEIEEVFAESQRIWQDHVDCGETMIDTCYNETGIAVVERVNR